ncbi:MAG: nitroreductase family protein [Chloroflexi bacterium]|nr:nitroreductase family protein [Chloroflexota bacterium]MCC6896407.1 nitroreductase family protein [Anaerolineae bacterium]
MNAEVEPGTHAFRDVVLKRRSIRRYRSEPVPREVIEGLLEAAIWSPSAHNRQPWRFAVVETDMQKETLAQAMGERLRRDLQADGVPAEVIEMDAGRSYSRITRSPVLVVLCLSMVDMDVYSDEKRSLNEYLMAVQSVAMAGQNILLAAHDVGLGACWMCAPLFCPDVVKATLNLPDDWQPQALLTIGYPAETREKTRKLLEASVVWR